MAKTKNKAPKEKKVSYHRQPEDLSLRQWQLKLRRQYGRKQAYLLRNNGDHPVWSDFTVTNPEGSSQYRVAIRGEEPGDNFCSCYDFRTSTLGTCKHVEWALEKLRTTWGNKQHFKAGPIPREYSSLAVDYGGEERRLRLRIGGPKRKKIAEIAAPYFSEDGYVRDDAWPELNHFLGKVNALVDNFRCYPDALDLIIQRREDARREQKARALHKQETPFAGLIKAQLYPYQRQGALFAFRHGRALLADEMGLGKTLQAITAAELLRRELGTGSTFIICPTSLKYQWRSEIEKFTDSTVLVIEGPVTKRKEQYADTEAYYKILTYNVAARDYSFLNATAPDLIILDEAQRIKNYDTKIAHAVKRLDAPHRIAITGTPLENKLEDVYSIVQFLDQYRLGPLWKLQARHEARDEHGAVRGYRHLDEINRKLEGVMIRRRKKDVAQQLPERVDQHLLVPMTQQQKAMHDGYASDVALLTAKWRRHGFLNEKDRQRLMSYLQLMRMACDSTFLIDQQSRHDTKLDELFYILEERLADPEEKVVIFSQWERMTRIVGRELENRGISFASLHGGVPSAKRGDLLDRFRDDEGCRVFLSTDAGGVGLNLQRAALVVNLDLPWNPAVLEQRIARVHRLGQKRGVQVINLISEGTIEHRMVHTLRFKSQLAEAILDTAADSVFVSDRKFNDFMEQLERIQDAPVTPSAGQAVSDTDLETPPRPAGSVVTESGTDTVADGPPTTNATEATTPPAPEPAASNKNAPPTPPERNEDWQREGSEPNVTTQSDRSPGSSGNNRSAPPHPTGLVARGIGFLDGLTKTLSDPEATQALVEEITEQDAEGNTFLKIPVENQASVANALKLLGGLFGGG